MLDVLSRGPPIITYSVHKKEKKILEEGLRMDTIIKVVNIVAFFVLISAYSEQNVSYI